jgi:hypothetical protein
MAHERVHGSLGQRPNLNLRVDGAEGQHPSAVATENGPYHHSLVRDSSRVSKLLRFGRLGRIEEECSALARCEKDISVPRGEVAVIQPIIGTVEFEIDGILLAAQEHDSARGFLRFLPKQEERLPEFDSNFRCHCRRMFTKCHPPLSGTLSGGSMDRAEQ